ncbi:MAG: hypothetical protein B7X76_05695 [Azorhizobium sp. 39-67-5]|nr:MAG: hypothetical protein B7X76_05695 [Azorhizobium sp. 39-67-5]
MNTNGKVVWSEGMFLRAQHFQQQDRYLERLVRLRVEGLWGGEVGKARPPQATSPPTYLSLAFLTCPSTFQCVCVWRDRWMDDGWVGRDGIEAASSISFRRFFAFMRGPVERDGMGWDGLGWAGLGRESWAIRPRGSRY